MPLRWILVALGVLPLLAAGDDPAAGLHLSIRFVPSFHPECRIDVTQPTGGEARITYRDADSSVSGKLTTGELAKLVRQFRDAMKRTSSQMLSASAARLPARLRGVETVHLDGTRYEFTWREGDTDFRLAYQDAEAMDRITQGDLALTKWANSVRVNLRRREALGRK